MQMHFIVCEHNELNDCKIGKNKICRCCFYDCCCCCAVVRLKFNASNLSMCCVYATSAHNPISSGKIFVVATAFLQSTNNKQRTINLWKMSKRNAAGANLACRRWLFAYFCSLFVCLSANNVILMCDYYCCLRMHFWVLAYGIWWWFLCAKRLLMFLLLLLLLLQPNGLLRRADVTDERMNRKAHVQWHSHRYLL